MLTREDNLARIPNPPPRSHYPPPSLLDFSYHSFPKEYKFSQKLFGGGGPSIELLMLGSTGIFPSKLTWGSPKLTCPPPGSNPVNPVTSTYVLHFESGWSWSSRVSSKATRLVRCSHAEADMRWARNFRSNAKQIWPVKNGRDRSSRPTQGWHKKWCAGISSNTCIAKVSIQ